MCKQGERKEIVDKWKGRRKKRGWEITRESKDLRNEIKEDCTSGKVRRNYKG
jgi:hypothetical protein